MSLFKKLSKGNTQSNLYFMNAHDSNGELCWFYVNVDKLKAPIFKYKCAAKTPNFNIKDYGTVVASGWGQAPTDEEKAEIESGNYENEDSSKARDYVIYYLTASDMFGTPVYYYAAVLAENIDIFEEKMKEEEFDVAEYGVVLISGYGDPKPEIREMMERDYGFSHARLEDPNAPIPFYSTEKVEN